MTDTQVGIEAFDVAGGSVCGREHLHVGRGSQDSLFWVRGPRSLVAVVSDGCGSGRHSEVGAKLGARIFAHAASRHLEAGASADDPGLWRRTSDDVLAHLRILANAMGGSLSEVVSDHFLFTLVGAAITPTVTATFALGDGLIAINGDVHVIGPFPGNQPPYLGYDLLDPAAAVGGGRSRVELHAIRPTREVDSILLGTDGAMDLRGSEAATLPGTTDPVGPLRQFWSDPAFFRNRDGIRRRLSLINRDAVTADWDAKRLARDNGLLPDDTTIVAIRRKGAGSL